MPQTTGTTINNGRFFFTFSKGSERRKTLTGSWPWRWQSLGSWFFLGKKHHQKRWKAKDAVKRDICVNQTFVFFMWVYLFESAAFDVHFLYIFVVREKVERGRVFLCGSDPWKKGVKFETWSHSWVGPLPSSSGKSMFIMIPPQKMLYSWSLL